MVNATSPLNGYDHATLLTGPRIVAGAGAGPAVLARRDQQFVPAVLDELTTESGRARLGSFLVKAPRNGVMRLSQPVHRVFHIALVEARCDTFGSPRLDPGRIDSAGLVVRRLALDPSGALLTPEVPQAWVTEGRTIRGWARLDPTTQADLDPDPKRRPTASSGHPEIDRRLAALTASATPRAEAVSPLFVAPPSVCAAAGSTLLFGMVPTTSAEFSESGGQPVPYDIDFVRGHLPDYLKPGLTPNLPAAGNPVGPDDPDGSTEWVGFLTMLRQFAVEWGGFGDTPGARALVSTLNGLTFKGGGGVGDFLLRATAVLLDPGGLDEGPNPQFTMPANWPAVGVAQSDAIARQVKALMDDRIGPIAGPEARYENPDALYRLRAFVRIKGHDGCPPRLVWSAPSDPFRIAAWYDPGDAPPTQIALPDITRASVKSIKPNVAFKVPASLNNLLNQNSPKDFLDNKGKDGGGIGLGWICGFSIPVITFCAFIVLNIFLSLFNIVFGWLFFVKICLPFPRRTDG